MTYVQNNITTIIPSWDQTVYQQDVYDCYYAQYYDRFFYDLSNAAQAVQLASDQAGAMTASCTDLNNFYDDKYAPCLGLAANGNAYFDSRM